MRKATKHYRPRPRGLLMIAVVFVAALVATSARAAGFDFDRALIETGQ